MGQTKITQVKDTDILSASEIGQYQYCSIAWYLQKCGYEPQSHFIGIGAKKHVELGHIMDSVQTKTTLSRALAILGYLLITIALLIILHGVIFK